MHDLCCVGHITLDKVVTPKNTVHMPGGTSFYFSHAIRNLKDINYTLVTAIAESEMAVANSCCQIIFWSARIMHFSISGKC